MSADDVLVLMPPSPPYMNVLRDYAGGYGVAFRTDRVDYGHDEGSAPYVSALYSAAVIEREGWAVDVLDCQAEQLTGSEALTRIKNLSPGLVVSVVSLPSMKGDLSFLDRLHELVPDARIVVVGTVCKLLYEEVLSSHCVTAAIRGDAEVVVPHLASAVRAGAELRTVAGIAYRGADGNTLVTEDAEPLRDLNSLPLPPYEKLPTDRYWEPSWGREVKYMSVLDGRGCPHRCGNYCPYPFGFGSKPLFRSPSLVVDEVEYLHNHFGIEAFIFRNQNFTLNRKHAENICQEMLRRKLSVRWLCETRLDSVDPEILGLMRSAGCERIHYGLESGDPVLFAGVGKPGCDLDGYGHVVEETKKAGMVAKLNVVVGIPGESWQSVRRTMRTIRHLKPDVVMAAIITPYPGTRVFEEAKRLNLMLTDDWSHFTGFDPVMRTEHLTAADLLRAQRMVSRCLDTTPLHIKALRKVLRLIR